MNLRRLFNIEPGESTLVILMMVYSAAIGIAINYYFTASSALFLGEFEIASLPFIILAAGFALIITRMIYARLEKRLSPARLQIASLVFLIVMLVAIRVGLALVDAPWLLFTVMVLFRVMILFLIVGFWSMANGLFTLTQSKRLFPLISAGDVIGGMIGAFLIPTIVSAIGTENLFLVVLGSIGLCLVCVVIVQRRFAHPRQSAAALPAAPTPDTPPPAFNPLRSRYIVLIFGLYILTWTLNYALDYTFLGQLQVRFAADPAQIAAFIGTLFGFVYLTNFVLKFFIAGRLISTFGLRLGLLIEPFVITFGILVSVIAGAFEATGALFFWVLIITKYGEEVLREAFNESSTRILYQPLPLEQRTAALTLVEGRGYPLAALVAGTILVFFTLTGWYAPYLIAGVMLLLGLLWVTMAILTYRQYTHTLRRALDKRVLRQGELFTRDNETLQLLVSKLNSEYPDEIMYVLNMLEAFDAEQVQLVYPNLLRSPSADLRLKVLERIEAGKGGAPAALIWELAELDPSPSVREAALRVYGVIAPDQAVARLHPYLESRNCEVRRGAMIGMLRSASLEGILIAGQQLHTMLGAANPVDRQTAAQVLGGVGVREFYHPLINLLQDGDPVVKQSALEACATVQHPKLIPLVITALSDSGLRSYARQALAKSGTIFLDELRERFERKADRRQLAELVRVCCRMRDEKAINALRPYLDWSQREVRTEVLRALSMSGYQCGERTPTEARIELECRETTQLRVVLHKVEAQADLALLTDALRQEVKAGKQRILYLLSFLYERDTINRARHALEFGTPIEQSYALEMLDILMSQHLKHHLRPVFSAAPHETHESLGTMLTLLLADEGHSLWLHAVVCYTLVRLDLLTCENPMLSMIERVLILKTAPLFAGIPDVILAEIAGIVEEKVYAAGETIFSKGDPGRSMFILVSGKVRVHDGEVTFNHVSERGVFGEMAVLASEPRTASITAVEETHVFRLDQLAFYEAMADYPEISQSIIRMLIGYLRDRMHDVTALTAKVQQLESRA